MFQCTPKRLEEGWELGECTGLENLAGRVQVTLFIPAQGETGLQLKIQRDQLTFSTSLSRLPQLDEPQASTNVTLLWQQPGNGIHSDIWAEDGLVFAPRLDGNIEILDADSGNVLGTASIPPAGPDEPNLVLDVKARGELLYAATVSSGLVVFDISQPSNPILIGQHRVFVEEGSPENFINIHNIFLSPVGNLVYAIDQTRVVGGSPADLSKKELIIIDVSDPASPREAGSFSIDTALGEAHDVNVIERDGRLIAFLDYLRAGLYILDVTDPNSIAILGSIAWDGIVSHSGWAFTLGDKLYYAHAEEGFNRHLTVLDVTDLANPRVVSEYSTREGASIHNVEVVEGIAYISYYIDGLRVVDLRDPQVPVELGHYDTVPAEDERGIAQGAWGVRVLGGAVYISDIETGTYALNVAVD